MTSVEMKRQEPAANLLAGGVGGLASLVIGHPFDTVKVRLQTMSGPGAGDQAGTRHYANARDCLVQMLRHEGPASLFRGMSALALSSVPRFALMFYANSWGRLLAGAGGGGGEVGMRHILLGGVFSQLVVAPTVTSPLERVKVLLQVFPGRFRGQLDCLSYIVREEGWRGLYRGSLLTLARDVPAFCSYFATYETLRGLAKSQETGRMGVLETAVIGGVSGVVGWAVEIPVDNVKNRHQVCLGQKPVSETVKGIIAEGGLRQLYRFVLLYLQASSIHPVMFQGVRSDLSASFPRQRRHLPGVRVDHPRPGQRGHGAGSGQVTRETRDT